MKLIRYSILPACLALGALLSWSCEKDEEQYTDVVEMTRVKEITYDSAVCVGYVKGVCSETGIWYAAAATPENGKTLRAAGGEQFEVALAGLEKGTAYLVRTYAVCNGETVYSPQKSFSTLRDGEPLMRITAPSGIGNTSATLEGYVVATGGREVLARGFCYGTDETPTPETGKSLAVKGDLGLLTARATELEDGTTYYGRVYVLNTEGIFYSDAEAFTTVPFNKPVPTVVTVTGLGTATMTVTAKAESDNDLEITARGIRYSLTEKIEDGTDVAAATNGKGEYQVTVNGLEAGQLYNVWAYAANRKGKVYSDMLTAKAFIRIDKVNALSRSIHAEITIANLGAFESPVNELGICWSTSPAPTTADAHLKIQQDGTFELGSYTSPQAYGMLPSTKYYVRAYAVNQYGRSYSRDFTFTTRQDLYDAQFRIGAGGAKLPYVNAWQVIVDDKGDVPNNNVPEEVMSPAFRVIYHNMDKAVEAYNAAAGKQATFNGSIFTLRQTTDGGLIMQYCFYVRIPGYQIKGWIPIQFERAPDGTFIFLQHGAFSSIDIYQKVGPEQQAYIEEFITYFERHRFYFEWPSADYKFKATMDNKNTMDTKNGPIRMVPADAPEDYWTFATKNYSGTDSNTKPIANPFK